MAKELNCNIPAEIQEQIKKYGAKEEIFEPVYRVSKRGTLDKETFISTYEEIISGQLPDDDEKYPKDKIGTYSTSVYKSIDPCRKFMKCLKKSVRLRNKYPFPVILKGKTLCGLTQLTCERELDYLDPYHIDWWIYEGKTEEVVDYYEIVKEV